MSIRLHRMQMIGFLFLINTEAGLYESLVLWYCDGQFDDAQIKAEIASKYAILVSISISKVLLWHILI